MKFNYVKDKETKNTVRFRPDAEATKVLGEATIYIQNSALEKMGIKDGDDIVISIEKAK